MNAAAPSSSRPIPKLLSLAGKTVVVTGAASGIGRATSFAAAELGAKLVITDRAPLDVVTRELKAQGVDVEALQGDLTEDGFADKLIAMGPIDCLAHCAGVLNRTPLHEDPKSRERFHQTMDINVRVPIDLGIAFTEHMAERGGGSIVMIGSLAGRTGGTTLSTPLDYAASKGAVHVVVRWLSRRAVGRGVMINGVAPGTVVTPMTTGNTTDASTLPLGRKGEPEEIAWMIMMLLTPAASFVSGAILDCNGGSYIG